MSRQRHAFEEVRSAVDGDQRGAGIDQHDIAMRALPAGKNGASDIPVCCCIPTLEIRQRGSPHAEMAGLENSALDAAVGFI